MTDPDQTVTWPAVVGDDLSKSFSDYEDSDGGDGRASAGFGVGLVSLGYIWAAVRRRARLWCAFAIVGFVLGAGYSVAAPRPYEASTSVLLIDDPNQDPLIEVQTDVALAESIPVAAGVVRQLGLPQTPTSFVGTYTARATTDQVVTLTAKGASAGQAVQIASALATQFLKFRAQYEQSQLQETQAELNQQLAQAQQPANAIASQIKQVSAQPNTASQQAELSSLQKQLAAANNTLSAVQQYITRTLASAQTVTGLMVRGSQVLNAAQPLKRSALKTTVVYAAGGLIGGMGLGVVIVIIAAITSDRLRRRDDIAYAFGAPVRLSVGPLREHRLVPDLPRRAVMRRRHLGYVVDHLRNAVPGSSKGPVGLAVVAVDDAPTVARALVELAISKAKQKARVVVADLSDGAAVARLLKVNSPGISKVSAEGGLIIVVVPARDDVAPIGPLKSYASSEGYAQADEVLIRACSEADLVLSLVTLDPALGGEHIGTWATDVVAVVTAGKSTAVRIHAVGEMIRLAGTRLGSVVVIDADKSDESLGVTSMAQPV